MRNVLSTLFVLAALAPTPALADEEIDVTSFEYVDVIETDEGSILRGVITEQTPKKYKLTTADGSLHVIRASHVVKITKQKNPRYRDDRDDDRDERDDRAERRTAATFASAAALPPVDEVETEVKKSSKPATSSGLRLAPEVSIVIPTGDLSALGGNPMLAYRTSFAPGVALGYEHVAGNVGITVGGLVRYTSWQMPMQIENLGSHSTWETQVFGRAAMQLGRAMPYGGLAIGLDTNRTANHVNGVRSTTMGLGANLQAGVAISASRAAVLDLGLDYHPGTDRIESGWDASVSYFALRLGATIRL